MGKALPAFTNPKKRGEILNGDLEAFTPNTITDPVALVKELEQVREQGYAVDREEITRGIICVGAPVFSTEGSIVAAISLTFPSFILADRPSKVGIH